MFEDLAIDLDFAGEEDAVVEARAKPKKLGRPRKSDVAAVKAKTGTGEEQTVDAVVPITPKRRGRPPKGQESHVAKKKGRPKKGEVEVTKTLEVVESIITTAPEAAFDDNTDYQQTRVEGVPTDDASSSQALLVPSEQVVPAPKRKGDFLNSASKPKRKGGNSIVSSVSLSKESQSSMAGNVGEPAVSLDVTSVTNSPPRSMSSRSSSLSHKMKDGTGETINIKAPKRMMGEEADKMKRTKKARTVEYVPLVQETFAQPAVVAVEDVSIFFFFFINC